MYEELVKRLRNISNSDSNIKSNYIGLTMIQAANAIEFLQTYKVAFENIVSTGGWWLVGQDKNIYHVNVPMNWPPKGTKMVELFPLPKPPKEET